MHCSASYARLIMHNPTLVYNIALLNFGKWILVYLVVQCLTLGDPMDAARQASYTPFIPHLDREQGHLPREQPSVSDLPDVPARKWSASPHPTPDSPPPRLPSGCQPSLREEGRKDRGVCTCWRMRVAMVLASASLGPTTHPQFLYNGTSFK